MNMFSIIHKRNPLKEKKIKCYAPMNGTLAKINISLMLLPKEFSPRFT